MFEPDAAHSQRVGVEPADAAQLWLFPSISEQVSDRAKRLETPGSGAHEGIYRGGVYAGLPPSFSPNFAHVLGDAPTGLWKRPIKKSAREAAMEQAVMMDWQDEVAPTFRRYVEAYPRLFAQSVVGAWHRGQNACIWRDQNGTIVGRAIIHSVSTMLFGAEYIIFPSRYYPSSGDVVNLRMRYSSETASRRRAFFACISCDVTVAQLVYRDGQWACRKCQHLINRSALIGSAARWGERLQALETLIGFGRPAHMRSARYDALRTELVELRGKTGPNPLVAHSGYADIITEEWHRTVGIGPVGSTLAKHGFGQADGGR